MGAKKENGKRENKREKKETAAFTTGFAKNVFSTNTLTSGDLKLLFSIAGLHRLVDEENGVLIVDFLSSHCWRNGAKLLAEPRAIPLTEPVATLLVTFLVA